MNDFFKKKAMSGQYFALLCFSITTCVGFLMKLIPPEAFLGLAATVITGYQLRKKEGTDATA
jgi:hypothetical protein